MIVGGNVTVSVHRPGIGLLGVRIPSVCSNMSVREERTV
jgi:hypothetical protein